MTSTERIKARMVKEAIEDNVDAIHNRLPKRLRPARRRLRLAVRWIGRVCLPVALLFVFNGQEHRSAAMGERPRDVLLPAERMPAAPAVPDPSALKETFPPRVLALSVRRIVIDAGHGGENLGTSSAAGLLEKAVTLDIASRLRQLMDARGFETVMTRERDETLSLQQRAGIANDRRGDIFVSIHLNYLEPRSARAIETFYLGPSAAPESDAVAARENQHSGYSMADMRALLDAIFTDARRTESRRLAEDVQRALMRRLGDVVPGLVDRGVKRSPFVVLSATAMPAVLAEVSCLSNADEAKRLGTTEYRQVIAEALAGGITTFAESSRVNADGKDRTSAR